MILGKEIWSKLKFTYVFPTTLSGKNEARTKDVQPQWKRLTKSTQKGPTEQIGDKSSRSREIWESEHVINYTERMHGTLDAQYQKENPNTIESESKHISNDKQIMIYNIITKYELLFGRNLGIQKTKPVDIELNIGAKTYH